MRHLATFGSAIGMSLALVSGAMSSASAATYDLASQFSGSQSGVWAYGYIAPGSPLGSFFPNYVAASGGNPIEYWNDPSLPQTSIYNTPSDAHNTSSSEVNCCNSVVFLPGQATFHPGQNDEVAAYRFTAPTSGVYSLQSMFSGRDYVGPTDTQVQIVVGGLPIFTGVVNGYAGDSSRAAFGVSPSVSFNDTLTLSAGDRLYFEVAFDPNGNRASGPFYYDTTGIAVTLSTGVPEPSTWAMMVLGFAGLAFAGYRSRKASAA